MGKKVDLLVMGGSLRKGSWNKKLARIAFKQAVSAGASVTYVDLADYEIPLYDGDLEETKGLPPDVIKLKHLMMDQEGFIFASPEYNSGVSGVLKNVIDWVSRPEEGEKGSLLAYRGKSAAIMSASPGALGGLRGLVHLRSILGNIGVFVVPGQVCIAKAHEAFDEDESLSDPAKHKKVIQLVNDLIDLTLALKNSKDLS